MKQISSYGKINAATSERHENTMQNQNSWISNAGSIGSGAKTSTALAVYMKGEIVGVEMGWSADYGERRMREYTLSKHEGGYLKGKRPNLGRFGRFRGSCDSS